MKLKRGYCTKSKAHGEPSTDQAHDALTDKAKTHKFTNRVQSVKYRHDKHRNIRIVMNTNQAKVLKHKRETNVWATLGFWIHQKDYNNFRVSKKYSSHLQAVGHFLKEIYKEWLQFQYMTQTWCHERTEALFGDTGISGDFLNRRAGGRHRCNTAL